MLVVRLVNVLKQWKTNLVPIICKREEKYRICAILFCSNLISTPDTNLNPVEFGWNSVDSVLMINKFTVILPEITLLLVVSRKKCTGRP